MLELKSGWQVHRSRDSYDWLAATLLLLEEWRSKSTANGVLCVMTPGTTRMLRWSADSWDYPVMLVRAGCIHGVTWPWPDLYPRRDVATARCASPAWRGHGPICVHGVTWPRPICIYGVTWPRPICIYGVMWPRPICIYGVMWPRPNLYLRRDVTTAQFVSTAWCDHGPICIYGVMWPRPNLYLRRDVTTAQFVSTAWCDHARFVSTAWCDHDPICIYGVMWPRPDLYLRRDVTTTRFVSTAWRDHGPICIYGVTWSRPDLYLRRDMVTARFVSTAWHGHGPICIPAWRDHVPICIPYNAFIFIYLFIFVCMKTQYGYIGTDGVGEPLAFKRMTSKHRLWARTQSTISSWYANQYGLYLDSCISECFLSTLLLT